MRHACLQPAGEDGLVARHGADRTCRPLPLSRTPIPRRLNKEIMMKKLALIATAAALFASGPAFAAIRTATLAVEHMTRSEERRVGRECVSTCRSRWWPYH